MVDVLAGKRLWKCPDCGREIQLSVTQLDPLACDECLAKLKGSRPAASAASPLAIPGLPMLLAIGGGLLVLGLIVGFIAGRASVPPAPFVRPTRPDHTESSSPKPEPATPANETEDDAPDEATRPGPNYKWVRGYTRKDGVKVKGHWAKK